MSGGTHASLVVAGIGSNGNEKMDYLNLAGRLGFAYQVLPNTVVRGGIGQVYDTVGYFGTLFGSVLTHNLPVLANEDINSSNAIGKFSTTLAAPPLRPAAPTIPANGIIPLSNNFNPQFRPERIQLPKVDQWNVAVQQQFGENTTFGKSPTSAIMRNASTPARPKALTSTPRSCRPLLLKSHRATSQPVVHSSINSMLPTTVHLRFAAAMA